MRPARRRMPGDLLARTRSRADLLSDVAARCRRCGGRICGLGLCRCRRGGWNAPHPPFESSFALVVAFALSFALVNIDPRFPALRSMRLARYFGPGPRI